MSQEVRCRERNTKSTWNAVLALAALFMLGVAPPPAAAEATSVVTPPYDEANGGFTGCPQNFCVPVAFADRDNGDLGAFVLSADTCGLPQDDCDATAWGTLIENLPLGQSASSIHVRITGFVEEAFMVGGGYAELLSVASHDSCECIGSGRRTASQLLPGAFAVDHEVRNVQGGLVPPGVLQLKASVLAWVQFIPSEAGIAVTVERMEVTLEPPRQLPDLVVLDAWAGASAQPAPDNSSTIVAKIRNGGPAPAVSSTVRFTERPSNGEPIVVGEVDVGSLDAGAEVLVSASWVPTRGGHDITVAADAFNVMEEVYEGNNVRETFLRSEASLSVLPLVKPDPVIAGRDAELLAAVFNSGSRNSDPLPIAVEVDGQRIGDGTVARVSPGEWENLSFSWVADVPPRTSHDLAVRRTDTGVVVERYQFFVTEAPTPAVRLAPDSQSSTIPPRGRVSYDFVVTNSGNVDDTFLIDKTPNGQGWITTLSQSRLELRSGESATVTLTVEAPSRRGAEFQATVTASSQLDPLVTDQATATTTTAAR